MSNRKSLLIDVISILPNEVDCYIQAPSLEDEVILSLMNVTEYEYYRLIKLKGNSKEIFINRIENYSIEEYFQSLEIKLNDILLFKGHDGVEFGIISSSIKLPEWFINRYVKTGMCNTSNDW